MRESFATDRRIDSFQWAETYHIAGMSPRRFRRRHDDSGATVPSSRLLVAGSRRGFGFDVVPGHGSIHRLDPQHDASVLEDPYGAVGFRDGDGDRRRGLGDRRSCPVAGSETLRECQAACRGDQDAAGRLDKRQNTTRTSLMKSP